MTKIFKKKVFYSIVSALAFMFSFIVFFVNSPNAYAAELKTVVLKSTDFTGEGEGSDNPYTLSNSSWAISNLAFYNYWNKDVISKTEAGQGSAFSSSIKYNNPNKYAILSVKVYGAGQNHSNTVDVSVTCGSETTTAQTVTQDKTDLTFNLSSNHTSSVVINFQHPAHTNTATIELLGTGENDNETFIEITAKEVSEVSIAKGDGVKSVYLSENQNATSGSVSGTKFVQGTTVYGFAELAKGYKAKSGWTIVSGNANTEGAKYRIGNKTVGSSAVSFGTISADLITYNITYYLNGGTHGSTHPATYNVNSNTFTISNPTKTGYTFNGWTGSNGTTPQTSVSIAKGSIGAREYTANWTANQYTVTLNKNEGTGGTDSVNATYNSAMPAITSLPTRENYDFAGYFDANGTKYYNEDGTSAKTWDKTSDTTLYAQWQVNVDGVIAFINDIGNVQYTPTSKGLIDAANTAYESLDSAQKLLVTNYDVLVQANTDYDKVDESVGKVNAIVAVEYTPECKALIDDARTTYDALTDYQKNIYPENTLKALVDAEKPYDAMDKINAIGEIENTKDCKDKVEAAKSAYDALTADQEALVYDSFVKILNDDVAAFNVIEKINESSNVKYTKESKDLIDNTKTLYSELTDEQKELVVNYDSLLKAEADYKEVDKVAKEINNIGDITYNEELNNKITSARASYEELTEDQKAFFPEDEAQSLVDYETTYVVLEKIYAIGDVEYTHESEDRIEEARNIYDSLTPEQKALINDDDLHMLIQSEDDYSSKKTTGIVWLVLFMILAINTLIGGLFFIFFLLWKRDGNKPNKVTTMSIAPLGLLFLTSHLTDGGFITLYVIVGLAILSWIGVLVIYILKKKGIIKPCITINGKNSKTEDKTDNEEVESPEKDEESQE